MKSILHLKIPMGSDTDDFKVSPQILGQLMKFTQERLGKDFLVVASPFDPSLYINNTKNSVLYNFNVENLTNEQFEKMLGGDNDKTSGNTSVEN